MNKPTYYTGLDLGQAKDYSALVVLERTFAPDRRDEKKAVAHYAVRHLQRYELGSSYTSVCDNVVEMFKDKPLAGSVLVVDMTGVGRPCVDMLRRASLRANLCAVSITGGSAVTAGDGGTWNVP